MKSLKTPNYPIGNRTHDLPGCSVEPQLTAAPQAPNEETKCFLKNEQSQMRSEPGYVARDSGNPRIWNLLFRTLKLQRRQIECRSIGS